MSRIKRPSHHRDAPRCGPTSQSLSYRCASARGARPARCTCRWAPSSSAGEPRASHHEIGKSSCRRVRLHGRSGELIGVGLGVAAAFPILINVFEAKWALPWEAIAVIAGLATGVSALGAGIVERSLMSEPPWRIPRTS
jgi:hypothetical protein